MERPGTRMRSPVLALAALAAASALAAQTPRVYTHADSLRGSYTSPGRAWWAGPLGWGGWARWAGRA